MVCSNPITINPFRWNDDKLVHRVAFRAGKAAGLEVPCGKCLPCKIQKANEWTTRILHTNNYFSDSCFVTLTFDEEHLPSDNSIRKRDLQLFFKRLRKTLPGTKVKYYACGEYGGKGGRPHYHIALFGWSPPDVTPLPGQPGKFCSPMLTEVWNYGFNGIGGITPQTAGYLCKYLYKGTYGLPKNYYWDMGLTPPFGLSSKGLGAAYVKDNAERLRIRPTISIYGHKAAMPKYYKKLLDLPSGFGKESAIEREVRVRNWAITSGFVPCRGKEGLSELMAEIALHDAFPFPELGEWERGNLLEFYLADLNRQKEVNAYRRSQREGDIGQDTIIRNIS